MKVYKIKEKFQNIFQNKRNGLYGKYKFLSIANKLWRQVNFENNNQGNEQLTLIKILHFSISAMK